MSPSVLQQILEQDAAWDAAEKAWDEELQRQWAEEDYWQEQYERYQDQLDYYHESQGHY